jgi:Tfp pilus assembly protein PilF
MTHHPARPVARMGLVASRIVFAVALALLHFAPSIAQSPPAGSTSSPANPGRSSGISHNIRGKVFMPSGNLPDHRIRVVLELNTGGIVSEAFSDSVGNFEFRSLPNGTYKIVIPTDGRLFGSTQEVVELYGNFARTFTAQIYLKDKNDAFAFKPQEKTVSIADFQEVPKDAKKSFDKGMKLARDNKPAEAAKHFQEAIKIFPEYLAALNRLGEQYRMMNKPDEAEQTFEKAIGVNSRYALPHINLGMLLVDQKRYDEAIESLGKGNSLDESYPMGHLSLGLALMSKPEPDFGHAEKELLHALEIGGKDFVYIRKYLFNLNIRRQNMDKAAEQLEAYLKESPEAPDREAVRQMLDKVKKAIAQQKSGSKD